MTLTIEEDCGRREAAYLEASDRLGLYGRGRFSLMLLIESGDSGIASFLTDYSGGGWFDSRELMRLIASSQWDKASQWLETAREYGVEYELELKEIDLKSIDSKGIRFFHKLLTPRELSNLFSQQTS